MRRVNKEQRLRVEGMNYALRIAKSKGIDELEKEWADKPTSAEWENKILIDCRDRIQNISQVQCETLSHLHKIRHLCAHPVKDATWDLYKPKRNEILYFFEYAIDMAIVPAYLNKKNFGDFLEDISKNYRKIIEKLSTVIKLFKYTLVDIIKNY